MAGNALRKPEGVAQVCQFLSKTIKSTEPGTLDWSNAVKKGGFFKPWDSVNAQEVRDRLSSVMPSAEPKANQSASNCVLL